MSAFYLKAVGGKSRRITSLVAISFILQFIDLALKLVDIADEPLKTEAVALAEELEQRSV